MSSWAPHFYPQPPPLLLGGLVTVFQPDSFGQADSFPTPSSYLLSVSLLICMISLGDCIHKHGFSCVPQTNNCLQVRPLCPPSDCSSQCFLGSRHLRLSFPQGTHQFLAGLLLLCPVSLSGNSSHQTQCIRLKLLHSPVRFGFIV